ncbi:Helicase, SNF2/RAD54 family [Olavius algarvensis Delta 1 endosymbiont]|nr:Helicase, SNF2/RAD54 family [Olavius algarvensis Delta 1 endosymbiont]
MSRKSKTKSKAKRRPSSKAVVKKPATSAADFSRLEFHRSAVALMPDPADRRPGIAFQIDGGPNQVAQQFCSCRTSGTATCSHQKELSRVMMAARQGESADSSSYGNFQLSPWHRLATVLAEEERETPATIRLAIAKSKSQKSVKVTGSSNRTLLFYLSAELDRVRFLERCTQPPQDAEVPTRGEVIRQLALLTLTKNERVLMDRGLKTRRQVLEETFWYKFAYHCFREFGANGCTLHPAIDESSGAFIVTGTSARNEAVFNFEMPRKLVKRVLLECGAMFSNQHGLTINPMPLDAIFDVKLTSELDIEISPLLRTVSKEGEAKFFQREDLKRFQYGDLYYIKELNLLAEDCYPEPPPKSFGEPVKTVIEKSQVPGFLDTHAAELESTAFQVHENIRRLEILKKFDRLAITPRVLERDWLWLSINYGAGNQSISLAEILKARRAKQRYVATEKGWVDCNSPQFDILDLLDQGRADPESPQDAQTIRLRRTDVLRLNAAEEQHLQIEGDSRQAAELKNFLDLNSVVSLPDLKGRVTPLRDYQVRGTEWLWFLFENGFGGLLCDDMGLGKTHQVMALMTALRLHSRKTGLFLVVCPTTVISHWHKKISDHAPDLIPGIYHGGERNLDSLLSECNTMLTSYGILLRDIEKMERVTFELAVFDEIQYIKNSTTRTYRAAKAIRARMNLGLTGTPIENTVTELKALLDVTTPGYLGADTDFINRYATPIEEEQNAARRGELSRLVAPFTLRRLKQSVLSELPAKIEDLRTCRLSEDQVKMYRDAVETRGRDLQAVLQSDGQAVPYMHIFALLNLLKQICDHPALVEKDIDGYDRYRSGKWDLFCELLVESLDSGQKVVIYSQYLAMIDIIEAFLRELNVGYVSLTGKSRNRGAIVERFNEEDDCRVYVGSLRAGGTGIDLVAASVVVHYDRWWNAAKEDQATDRVHRIGQRRGVQVFKLVTEGTLEEKIAAIIAKKRKLMDSVVKEDDPGLLKSFTREDLMALIDMPMAE